MSTMIRRIVAGAALVALASTTVAALMDPGPAGADAAVPSRGTSTGPKQTSTTGGRPTPSQANAPPEADAKVPCPEAPARTKVNLNTASRLELEALPGIGPKKAERIIEWRRARGPFRRVRDLRRVRGFGRKSVLRLAPYLTVE